MTWTPIAEEEMRTARLVVTWIRTARGSSVGYPADWLPSESDFTKSALFERLRSGKEPLPEPPPLGMSCPWYAVVEDPGPHYVFDVHIPDDRHLGPDPIVVLQNVYRIVERCGPQSFVVKDARDTSYRFALWYDAEWRHPGGRIVGGWFMRNVEFERTPAEGSAGSDISADQGTPS